MGQVTISINGKAHAISCGDGEEAKVKNLGSFVDKHVRELSKAMPQASDTKLLLMASLLIADELEGMSLELDSSRKDSSNMEALVSDAEARQLHHDVILANNAQDMNLLADRIHDLVEKIKEG